MAGLWKYDLMLLGAVGLALLLFRLDHEAAVVTAAHVKAADEKKADVSPEDRMALRYPLDCDATVIHYGTPGELPRVRCYHRKEAK